MWKGKEKKKDKRQRVFGEKVVSWEDVNMWAHMGCAFDHIPYRHTPRSLFPPLQQFFSFCFHTFTHFVTFC